MGNVFLAQQRGELLVQAEQEIFRAAIEIDVRQPGDTSGRQTARDFVNVICLARL